MGTDLGGNAIMIGGTNGAHLNSFSMTDILSHGRACSLMNPYYVVFFSVAIDDRLREVGTIFKKAGYIQENVERLKGRDKGLTLAKGMIRLSKNIIIDMIQRHLKYSIEKYLFQKKTIIVLSLVVK